MLKNLTNIGQEVKLKFERFHDWQELEFNEQDKNELSRLEHVSTVFNSSIKFEFDNNHTIIPSQYVLYALAIKEFATGLKHHLDVFDVYKRGKDRNLVGRELQNNTFDRGLLNLDHYSQSIALEPIINQDYNFNAKSIINGNQGNYKIRGTSDFFSSVILKIINVPDASSAILGKFIYYLTENPDVFNYLERRFMNFLPVLVEDSTIKGFAKRVFEFIDQYDDLSRLNNYIQKNSDVSFSSLKYNEINLTSIFKTSNSLLSESDLTQGGKQRFFSDPIFHKSGDFYYFSTEWTDGTGSRLDLTSLETIIEHLYPEFKFKRDGAKFKMVPALGESSNQLTTADQVSFSIDQFTLACRNAGLVYSDFLVSRFVSALLTKPFVILTGLSGSGKTKLAQAFVQWIVQDESQYSIVPVGADWTNREPLLGFPNALNSNEYIKPDSGVVDLIVHANENPTLPFFLILDEMNLSHVERYFADFLSVMESNESIPMHSQQDLISGVPSSISLPKNLFIIGTVNIDETTNMFSPKVLDRANTIEFRINPDEMSVFLGSDIQVDMNKLKMKGSNMATSFVTNSQINSFDQNNTDELAETLSDFFKELQKIGAEFGYRTASEIMRLVNQLSSVNSSLGPNNKIDFAIMQKLLPKLHGSRRKLCPILVSLGGLCLSKDIDVVKEVFEVKTFDFNSDYVKYPLTLEKLSRMYQGAIDNGFASFAEA